MGRIYVKLFSALLLPAVFFSASAQGKPHITDTLVNVGGYRLHFHIVQGKGIPILFDAGGGNDGSVWESVLTPVASITGATVIAYDRPGFGKSELDTNRHGIVHGVEGLEAGVWGELHRKKIIGK